MKYFGTDGIRGVANDVLTPEIAFKVGRVIGSSSEKKRKIFIGKDSRISCDMLEAAMIAGITASGADVYKIGVIPTPAINYLVKKYEADYGVVISASHNPVIDNGVKVINNEGRKISHEEEMEIERHIDGETEMPRAISGRIGRVEDVDYKLDYIDYLLSTINIDNVDFKVVIDCANGAASTIAPIILDKFIDNATFINFQPNGLNINDSCGSTDIRELSETVIDQKADLGIAFDGDADRIIFVDSDGNEVDGDCILYILARKYLNENKLINNKIAVTTMSNLGFINCLKKNLGVDVVTTDVGDKYVSLALESENLNLGGETSGHIILRDIASSGDGILVALQVLEYLHKNNESLKEAVKPVKKYPSSLINIKVIDKDYSLNHRNVLEEIKRVENILEDSGRVFVRASGTEQLVRVLVECEDEEGCIEYCNSIAETIKELNGKES